MKKCQFISKEIKCTLEFGKYYNYNIIPGRKNSDGNIVYLKFPYHIYDDIGLVEVINETSFLKDFIDITKLRKEKLLKINQTR